jgi:hypothetical protein
MHPIHARMNESRPGRTINFQLPNQERPTDRETRKAILLLAAAQCAHGCMHESGVQVYAVLYLVYMLRVSGGP